MIIRRMREVLVALGLCSAAGCAVQPPTTHPDRAHAVRNYFSQIAEIIAPDDPSLIRALDVAMADPVSYLKTHEDTLDRLWASATPENDPSLVWLALVDRSSERRIVNELDWKLDARLTLHELQSIKGFQELSPGQQRNIELLFDLAIAGEQHTGDFLHHAAESLADSESRLAMLRIDSDSYPVFVITADGLSRLQALASGLRNVLNLPDHQLDIVDLADRVY